MNQLFKLTTLIGLLVIAACSPTEIPSKDLIERQGLTYEVNSQTPFSGSSVDYHSNGQLLTKSNYKDGKRDGLWEYFGENGQLRFKSNYKDGKEDGLQESYYENGQLQTKFNGKDGQEHGLYESYDENGQLKDKICFKNGEEVDMSNCEK